jgi:hypothetical protein
MSDDREIGTLPQDVAECATLASRKPEATDSSHSLSWIEDCVTSVPKSTYARLAACQDTSSISGGMRC